MATKYVTLKGSNGDTLYPQAVATNLAPASVKADDIDFTTIGSTCTTIWEGNLYQTGDVNKVTLNEAVEEGKPYVITVKGLSSGYLMEFICTFRSCFYQASYYDGTTVVRWRINFLNESGGQSAPFTKMYLDNASTNMSATTAIVRVAKLIPANIS